LQAWHPHLIELLFYIFSGTHRRKGLPISSPNPSAQSDPGDLGLSLNRRYASLTLLVLLIAAEITLVVLDAWISYGWVFSDRRTRDLFSLRAENSLGTWFSSVQLLMLAAVLGVTMVHGRQASRRSPAWWATGWLGVICLYVSIDEVAQIHERIGRATRLSGLADSFPSYPWLPVLSPLLVVTAVLIVLLVARYLKSFRARLLVSLGLVVWIIAIGVEFVQGLPGAHAWLADAIPLSRRFVDHFSRVIEEFFEMLGCSLLLTGFLTDLLVRVNRVEVKFV